MTADAKGWLQLGLAMVGAGALLGSVIGGFYGWASSWCWCNEELR